MLVHSKVSAKSDGADATKVQPSDWNDNHVIKGPRQVVLPNAVGGGTTIACTFPRTPLTDSVFFICSEMVVSTVQAISSISQTNVTWTLIHAANNGTSAKVELWVGVGNGSTPGTTATITYAGTITNAVVWASEWPGGYLTSTPVLDQSADATGTGTNQATGVIVPTVTKSLTFVLACVANGTIEIRLRSPYPFVEVAVNGGFFGVFGYLWGSTGSLIALIPSQTSAAWVNSIISVK